MSSTAETRPSLDLHIRGRLSIMMFLQYFVWGAWFVTLYSYLKDGRGFADSQIGWAYGTASLAAIIAPFFVGMIADRYFATQRMLAVLHLAGAGLLYLASTQTEFNVVFALLLAYFLCYMPTLALTNSLSFHHLPDPGRQFPGIRVLGTIGWIVAGITVGFLGWRGTASPMHLAAGASALLAIYCLALPDTPPANRGKSVGVGDVLGLDALKLLKSFPFAVFVVGSFLVSIPLQFYYFGAEGFLGEKGVDVPANPSALYDFLKQIKMTAPASMMTFGQMSEIFFMLVMPLFFARLGVKWMLVVGMACWTGRYLLFAFGNPNEDLWMYFAGILLHGVCYDFFFVTGQIYVDKKASAEIRGAAQGFIAFVTLGVGGFIGTTLAGGVVGSYVTGQTSDGRDIHDWGSIWLIPAAGAAAVMVLFAITFYDHSADEAPANR